MEENLIRTLDKALTCESRTNRFAHLYKCKGYEHQKERRKVLLEEQKKRRQLVVDSARGINDLLQNDLEEAMDVSKSYTRNKHLRHTTLPHYCDRLMLAEWLEDVPEDLETNWCMIPCPKGHRVLVISSKRKTIAVNKVGVLKAIFTSLLPGGNKETFGNHLTILDCVWNFQTRCYYVLDVLAWNNQSFINCDTQFRLFWLSSKFNEIDLSTISQHNVHPFVLLPNYPCEHDKIKVLLSQYPLFEHIYIKTEAENSTMQVAGKCGLDGLLFYHKEAAYEAGHTPLAGWLKPFMIPEVLKIDIFVEYLKEMPEDYKTLAEYIDDSKKLSTNWWTKGKKKMPEEMNTEEIGN